MAHTKLGENISLDLSAFIDSRCLIQANSGAGKSYAIRKLLEQTHGKVQQIVLDIEGEFSTLREKFDYVLVGKSGDIPTSIKTAEMLSHKILELGISTIIDLYELKKHERVTFVQRFCDALVNAPKELWHPVMVVIDECHLFCPEKEKCESTSAVIDLGTRGRKRGFALVAATQRLAKLNKDLAAELGNKLIGRTGLDIDMKRAAEELGFTRKEDLLSLRSLEPGEFFVFGPAMSKEVVKGKIGKVVTSHPQSGGRISTKLPPPPREKVKAALARLKELPKEVEKELKTKQDLMAEIRSLRGELGARKRVAGPVADKGALAKERVLGQQEGVRKASQEANQVLNSMRLGAKQQQASFGRLQGVLKQISQLAAKAAGAPLPEVKISKLSQIQPVPYKQIYSHTVVKQLEKTNKEVAAEWKPEDDPDFREEKITGGALRMLQAAATYFPEFITKLRMAAIAGLSYKSGTFTTYLAMLKRNGLVTGTGNEWTITDKGREVAGEVPPLPSGDELLEMWCKIVSGGAARMLRALHEIYPDAMDKEALAEAAGLSIGSGTFTTYLATLKRNGLITVSGGEVKAADELFE